MDEKIGPARSSVQIGASEKRLLQVSTVDEVVVQFAYEQAF